MAAHMHTELVIEALDTAAKRYPFADDVIFHPDRGVQSSPRRAGEAPTAQDFADHTESSGIRRSVGRTGVCYDNAQAETFNSALKNERVNRTQYPTREHARKDVTRYIEIRYHTLRLHSALGHRTPREAYNDHTQTTTRSVRTHQVRVRETRGTSGEVLCERRNHIAHGREHLPSTSSVREIHESVVAMMEGIRHLLIEHARERRFLHSVASG